MTRDPCHEELVLLERRGRLIESERLALEEHLRTCESCRMTRDFGAPFDEPLSVATTDDAQLERMMLRAERWLEQPRSLTRPKRASPRRNVVLLAAAIAVTASAAAAAVAIRSRASVTPPPAQHSPSTVLSAVRATPDRTRAAASPFAGEHSDAQPNLAPGAQVPGIAPGIVSRDDAAQGKEPEKLSYRLTATKPALKSQGAQSALASTTGAEQLLRDAGLARRNGQLTDAGRLYRKLQQLYPASREAGLSLVTYGSLLLEQHNGVAALDQFNRYLAQASSQSLAAEALYGKARSLAALGRTSEERSAWQKLLERFPKSPYAAQARKRLGQIN